MRDTHEADCVQIAGAVGCSCGAIQRRLWREYARQLQRPVERDELRLAYEDAKRDLLATASELEALRGTLERMTPQHFAERAVRAELARVAAWIRSEGNIWREDAIDECARVLENRARSYVYED